MEFCLDNELDEPATRRRMLGEGSGWAERGGGGYDLRIMLGEGVGSRVPGALLAVLSGGKTCITPPPNMPVSEATSRSSVIMEGDGLAIQ